MKYFMAIMILCLSSMLLLSLKINEDLKRQIIVSPIPCQCECVDIGKAVQSGGLIEMK